MESPDARKMGKIQGSDQGEVQREAPSDSDIAIMFSPGRDPAGVVHDRPDYLQDQKSDFSPERAGITVRLLP